MSDQLPADIAEAISEFGREATAFGAEEMVAFGDQQALATARAALDAVILKHLRAVNKPETVAKIRFTAGQHKVLSHLVGRSVHDGAPSASDISRALSRRYDDWAYGKLVSLEKRGLVERLGSTFSGAQCWGATDLGRSALADEGRGA